MTTPSTRCASMRSSTGLASAGSTTLATNTKYPRAAALASMPCRMGGNTALVMSGTSTPMVWVRPVRSAEAARLGR